MGLVIWGAGAIGGTLGAHLVRAGEDVGFVDQDAAHVAAMAAGGLRIRAGDADVLQTGPLRAALPADVRDPLREVVLAVKAPQTAAALAAIAPRLAPDGFVVSLQNGLNEDAIAGAVGPARTVGAFVNFSADYLEPGVIAYGGPGKLALGEPEGRVSPRVTDLARRFAAFLPCEATDNVAGYLWSKLGYGAMLFGTALVDASMADAVARHRRVLVALGTEPLEVAAAIGVRPLPFDRWEPALLRPAGGVGARDQAALDAAIDGLITRMRGDRKQKSGIWRDLAVRHRRTEVDFQLGEVVAHGERAGVATPLCAACARMIHEIEEGRRAMSWDNLAELEAAG